MSGHLFVVQGDIKQIACDAWALPTDRFGNVTADFADVVGLHGLGRVPDVPADPDWTVIPYPGEGAQDDRVWLLNAGADKETPASWYAERGVAFVAKVAKELPSRRMSGRHEPGRFKRALPIVALNVLGTGKGGHSSIKGGIYEALIPELADAAEANECDVILVTWGRRAYAAAQRVRLRMLGDESHGMGEQWAPLGPGLASTAEELAGQVQRGNLVLFFGAGISAGAGLPGWQELLRQLAHGDGLDIEQTKRLEELDLRDQAAILERLTGVSLGRRVADLMSGSRYSLGHGILASLHVKEAVTTNYDQLFEMACRAADAPDGGRGPDVLPYSPASPGGRWLLKLHGSVEKHDSITLTRGDYQSLMRNHGALLGLVQAMLLTKHMLFVGYSLTDEDFHDVMRDVRAARAEAENASHMGTVVTLFEDAFFAKMWGEELDVKALGGPLMPAEDHAERQVATRGRVLEIFLDRLALHAADLDAFLLDETYSDMLDADEIRLRDAVTLLQDALSQEHDAAGWERVRDLVRHFGGDQTTPKVPATADH